MSLQSQDCFTSLFIFMSYTKENLLERLERAVDHRSEIRLEDRSYEMERDSFEYQCQSDRFSY